MDDETLTTVDAQLERIVLAMESINAIIEADNGGGGAKSVKTDEPKDEEKKEEEKDEPIEDEPKDEPIEKKLNLDDLDKVGDDDADLY